jgi:hypothetical protein
MSDETPYDREKQAMDKIQWVPFWQAQKALDEAIETSFSAGLQIAAIQHAEGRCDDC